MKYIFSKTLQFGKIYEIYTPFVFLSNSVSFFVPHTWQGMISKSFFVGLLGLSLEWWLLLKISENFSNQGVTIYGLWKGTAGPTVSIYLLSGRAHLNEVSKPKANPHVEAIYKANENSVRFLWPVKAWENTQSSHGLFGVGFWLVEKSVQSRATNKTCTISK